MTDDLADRLARLNASVAATLEQRKRKRAEQWARLQADDPAGAQFLADIKRAFPGSRVVSLIHNGEKLK